jgi:hypothetical protein
MAASKELFVNEYRSLLSNRLLAHCSYVTDKEIRYLELFKLRFVEVPFPQCEVMIKDFAAIIYKFHEPAEWNGPEAVHVAQEDHILAVSGGCWWRTHLTSSVSWRRVA